MEKEFVDIPNFEGYKINKDRNTGCFDLNIRLAVKTGSLYKNRYKFVNP